MHLTSCHRRAGAFASVLLLAAATTLPSCGGGGGGGGGGPPDPPGTLAAIALQGAAAPDLAGTFDAFSSTTKVDVCDGGWTAFVAGVSGTFTGDALYVARPDGSLRLVYATGDTLPDSTPGTGTITDFERIFVRVDTLGVYVVALVAGTAPTEGIVTARIDGAGNVVEKAGAVYVGDTLPGSDNSGTRVNATAPGTLDDIDDDLVAVSDHGETFFHGDGSSLDGIWSVTRDGASTTSWATQLDHCANSTATLGTNFVGLGIDADGAVVAFSTNSGAAPIGARDVFASDVTDVLLVARDFDAAPGVALRQFANAFAFGPLDVSLDSGVGFVTWTAQLTGGSPDLAVYTRQIVPTLGTLSAIIVPGEAATEFGAGAVVGDSGLLGQEQDANRVTIRSTILGGSTNEVFSASSGPGSLLQIWHQGTSAPHGGAFTNAYPSLLTTEPVQFADNVASLAVVATVSTPSTGVYWGVAGLGITRVAAEGGAAPGTGSGTFASFGSPALVTTATGVVVFRATVNGGTAASGLFRQL